MHGGYDYTRVAPPPPPSAVGADRDPASFMPDPAAAGINPDYMEIGSATPSSSTALGISQPVVDSYTLTSLDCGGGSSES